MSPEMSPDMRPDTELRRTLHDAADNVAVPPVDVEGLRAAGRRHARRRTAVTALASAAVLAVVVGSGVALTADDGRRSAPGPVQRTERPDQSPEPAPPAQPLTVADLPVGDQPQLSYFEGGTLYSSESSADMEGPGRLRDLAVGGGVALGVHTEYGVVRVDPIADLIKLGVDGSDVAVSADGRWGAWLVSADDTSVGVHLWDLRQRRSVATARVPVRGQCCDGPVQMRGVDSAGRVFITGVNGTFVWDHRERRSFRVDDQPYGIDQILPTAAVMMEMPTSKDELTRYTLGRVDEVGTFVAIQTVPGYHVRWAPDGSRPARWAQPDAGAVQVDGDRVEVMDPVSGEWVPMLAPKEASLAGYMWEDTEHLLVAVYDAGQHWFWLRCAADDGRCEHAADLGPEGARRLLPDR